jgi:hypothetical protein
MCSGFVRIDLDNSVLLIGRPSIFQRLPPTLRNTAAAISALDRAKKSTIAMGNLRDYFTAESVGCRLYAVTDQNIIDTTKRRIERRELGAILLPKASSPGLNSFSPNAVTKPPPRLPQPGLAPPGSGTPSNRSPQGFRPSADQPQPRPIAQWSTEERLKEVVGRAAKKVPGDVRNTVLSLLAPESLAIMAGTIVVGAAANLTPYGWAADIVIAGIAFVFGGLAALHALGDLVECFKKISGARTDRDLDDAADALASAVVALGTLGLMAVLHRATARKAGASGGSSGSAEGASSSGSTSSIRSDAEIKETSLQRMKPAQDPPMPPPPPPTAGRDAPGSSPANPAALRRKYSAEIDSVSTFKTLGLDRAAADNYLETADGKQLLRELSAADPSADAAKIYARALDQLSSGSSAPVVQKISSSLVKIVPHGETVSPYSPFFTTPESLRAASESGKSLCDYFGLPMKSEAATYDIYQITPTGSTTVFVSEVAPTSELGGLVQRSGGAFQYIVPNRSLWSSPTFLDTIKY